MHATVKLMISTICYNLGLTTLGKHLQLQHKLNLQNSVSETSYAQSYRKQNWLIFVSEFSRPVKPKLWNNNTVQKTWQSVLLVRINNSSCARQRSGHFNNFLISSDSAHSKYVLPFGAFSDLEAPFTKPATSCRCNSLYRITEINN